MAETKIHCTIPSTTSFKRYTNKWIKIRKVELRSHQKQKDIHKKDQNKFSSYVYRNLIGIAEVELSAVLLTNKYPIPGIFDGFLKSLDFLENITMETIGQAWFLHDESVLHTAGQLSKQLYYAFRDKFHDATGKTAMVFLLSNIIPRLELDHSFFPLVLGNDKSSFCRAVKFCMTIETDTGGWTGSDDSTSSSASSSPRSNVGDSPPKPSISPMTLRQTLRPNFGASTKPDQLLELKDHENPTCVVLPDVLVLKTDDISDPTPVLVISVKSGSDSERSLINAMLSYMTGTEEIWGVDIGYLTATLFHLQRKEKSKMLVIHDIDPFRFVKSNVHSEGSCMKFAIDSFRNLVTSLAKILSESRS